MPEVPGETASVRDLEGSGEKHEISTSHQHDDPFGDEEFAAVRYRTMAWCAVILIVGLGLIATYTGYVLGQFRLQYPHVHNMADAGEVLMGRFGRELFGSAQLIVLIFVMGSHILTFSIMMNTLTNHGTCTIVFNIIGMALMFLGNLPRTLKNVSWLSIGSFIGIFSAVLVTMITIAIEHPWRGDIEPTNNTSFYEGFVAVTDIVFAYAGHVNFFSFISEMKEPKEYPKTLYLLQSVDVAYYVVATVVIYYYGGQNVASPALGSLSPLMSKVAYGIAIPEIVIGGVINGHVASKYVYVRLFRGTNHMHQRNLLSLGSWVLITFGLWVIAWIIAEGIPVFNPLLGLVTAYAASSGSS
ncbi:uncharacterized protein PFLUO_LOCUS2803 [Penicillium psychrofluorescens]|uniref:uncharacterized protein n=1 Tax=Penicillium psychrofluorescens TaxID=3158075 RepID=UPI003CCDA56C